jgi:hypothetical protein
MLTLRLQILCVYSGCLNELKVAKKASMTGAAIVAAALPDTHTLVVSAQAWAG